MVLDVYVNDAKNGRKTFLSKIKNKTEKMNESERIFFDQQGIIFTRVIAEGGFGVICLVYHSVYEQHFVLKKVPQERFKESEIECLKQLDQPNIINLYNTYSFEGYIYMLMEYCPYDLYQFLKKNPEIPIERLSKYCYDILIAIKACHDHKIAHNDIKPSNFLIDKYGRIKVCDFGLSAIFEDDVQCKSTRKGTSLFMAPELFKHEEYNPMKADVWAIGVTFYYMATQNYPFYHQDRNTLRKLIEAGVYPYYSVSNQQFCQVIGRCLVVDPEERATVDELLDLPFFRSFTIQNMHKNSVNLRITQSYNTTIVKPTLKTRNKLPNRASLLPYRANVTDPHFKK